MELGLLYEFEAPKPWEGEHPWGQRMPCNDVVLGALSQITENIRLGFGVTLMPHEFIHPARVAEKVATVDLLSRGRAEWGMGRSTPMEQIAFGVDAAQSKKKMLAACRTVSEMWAQEYYE
jgi:alkanesulfonate monooxygenase SsuD/methylene tetrahydromethanopterin reductase-like flavin-dependent oxidoreductase (luciferase family)